MAEQQEVQEVFEAEADSVFVGNLAFETSVDDLNAHLANLSLSVEQSTLFENRSGRSKGCAMVKFSTTADAERAVAELTDTMLGGRQIFARPDRGARKPTPRPAQTQDYEKKEVEPADPTFLYVGNLAFSVTSEDLSELFAQHGTVVAATVSKQRRGGRSQGWGTVQFETEEEASAVLAAMNGVDFQERPLNLQPLKTKPRARRRRKAGGDKGEGGERKQQQQYEPEPINECQLHVGNLAWSVEDDQLADLFAQFGEVISAEVARGGRNGRSRGWGSVEMSTLQEATAALEGLNGTAFAERDLDVQIRTGSRRRRQRDDRGDGGEGGDGGNREPRQRRVIEPIAVDNPGAYLYVGNLSWDVEDDQLADLFAAHGEVVSAVITRNQRSRRSRGWGMVQMGTAEAAQGAVEALNDTDYQERALIVRLDNKVVQA
jgi:RNA recognition motif-containing protein